MKKNLKLLISSTLLALSFLGTQTVYGMDPDEPKAPSRIQLSPGPNDTLEAVLGTGTNILLRLRMDLKDFRKPTDEKHLEVPVRLFLTDFTSFPTNHPAIDLQVKVDCESTAPICKLPSKPKSFDSYTHFMNWMKQGYFTNQVNITYDFPLNVQQSASSLAQHLFFLPPEGYQFIGTHVVDNTKIPPDNCLPEVHYVSQRGKVNTTTATLGGILYLNKKPYPVDDYHQVLPHQMIKEIVLKEDKSKQFYHPQWLAPSEITSKLTYEEFDKQQIENWPNIPAATYSVAHRKPGNKENIKQLSCVDGSSGKEVDISDGRIFLIDCAVGREGNVIESLVKDADDALFLVKYRNLTEEVDALHLNSELEQYDQEVIELKNDGKRLEYELEREPKCAAEGHPKSIFPKARNLANTSTSFGFARPGLSSTNSAHGFGSMSAGNLRNDGLMCICEYNKLMVSNVWIIKSSIKEREGRCNVAASRLKSKMVMYDSITGSPHPRWNEFSNCDI